MILLWSACNKGCGTVHGTLADGCHEMGVHVRCDADRAVPEELAHGVDVSPSRQQQTGSGVPEAVECQLGENARPR
jgi:hypothetical protein